MNLAATTLYLIQVIPLVAVLLICICRINAMQPCTRRSLKVAYILLSAASFFMLMTTSPSEFNRETFFVIGVALCFITDRRKSVCYADQRSVA